MRKICACLQITVCIAGASDIEFAPIPHQDTHSQVVHIAANSFFAMSTSCSRRVAKAEATTNAEELDTPAAGGITPSMQAANALGSGLSPFCVI